MAEHPILFSTEMVKAILGGRKTQTRRICNERLWPIFIESEKVNSKVCLSMMDWEIPCPYGKVGDTFWVKEDYKYLLQSDMVITYYKSSINKDRVIYTPWNCLNDKTQKKLIKGKQGVWKSKLLMFKFMARIFLEITNIKVERVQEITLADIKAEGLPIDRKFEETKTAWIDLWDSLNAKRGYDWDKNSWVWVIEFKKQLPER